MTLMTESRTPEPGRGKLFTAVSQVLATKHSQLEHLFRCQLRLEIGMKILSRWLSEVVNVTCLHQVVDLDRDYTLSHRFISRLDQPTLAGRSLVTRSIRI